MIIITISLISILLQKSEHGIRHHKRYVSIVYGHQSCDTIQLNTLVVEMGFLCFDSKL